MTEIKDEWRTIYPGDWLYLVRPNGEVVLNPEITPDVIIETLKRISDEKRDG